MIVFALLLLHIRGAAFNGKTLITWGERILSWTVPNSRRVLAIPLGPVGEGGCLDEDGQGLFLEEGGNLVHRRSPRWDAREIDHGIDMHDCLVTTLLGRRGVLMVQKGMQVRFYKFPDF